MKDWQLEINDIMERDSSNEDKIKKLQYLRLELSGEMHSMESYVDKVDYCIYSLKTAKL